MINKDGQTATVSIAVPAQVTWSMPVLDRADDILEIFDAAGIGISDRAKASRILSASIIADRNTARVHLTD